MPLREDILEVSRTLLVKNGFGKMSMRKIAKRAGVSATSIYLHFQNKDELLLALMESSIAKLALALEKDLADSDDSVTKLEKMAQAFVDFALKIHRSTKLSIWCAPKKCQSFRKKSFSRFERSMNCLRELSVRERRTGALAVEDPLMSCLYNMGTTTRSSIRCY